VHKTGLKHVAGHGKSYLSFICKLLLITDSDINTGKLHTHEHSHTKHDVNKKSAISLLDAKFVTFEPFQRTNLQLFTGLTRTWIVQHNCTATAQKAQCARRREDNNSTPCE